MVVLRTHRHARRKRRAALTVVLDDATAQTQFTVLFFSPKRPNNMKICVLSVSEFRAMQKNVFHRPPCTGHIHIEPKIADQLLLAEGGEWIKGHEGRRLFAYPSVVWKKVAMSMQLVRGVIQGRKGTFRYPVLAAVDHGRLQNVRAINAERAEASAI